MGEKLRNMASVYIQFGNQMLLLYRQGSRVVNDVWVGSAGGHFEEHELNDPRSCVLREMQEELGITEDFIENLRLRYVTLRHTPKEIRQNYYFFCNLKSGIKVQLQSNEGILRWFEREELADLPMPLSARKMIDHYLREGAHTDTIYCGVTNGDGAVFVPMTEC